eukprot:TRINITY_DN18730_c0_g1_i1.p1 TRINITY_DN18730_c0_g1~~TRINITY_DN18730_c0_g1_i1.p1  ORF type:complete len:151 (+),score=9.06 TRINITY_DN18730_c0_g1_i1:133-585(+)
MEPRDSEPADDSVAQPPDPAEVSSAWLRARAMRGHAKRLPSGSPSSASTALPDDGSSQSSFSGSSAGMDRTTISAADLARDLHDRGLCQPCAYYSRKSDGCRKNDACEFCHLCDNARYQFWKRRIRKFKELEQLEGGLDRNTPWGEEIMG